MRTIRIRPVLMVSGLLAGVSPVWSSDAGGKISLFAGDLGNAIWTLVIFTGLILVLGKFAWGPILSGLKKREDFIRESLTHAQAEREEAKRLLEEHMQQIKRARQEATAIVDESRRDAEEVKKRIVAEAKTESEALVKRAKKDIELAREDAVKQLHDQTVLLATNIAGKIVRRQMAPGDHQALMAEALSEMGKMN